MFRCTGTAPARTVANSNCGCSSDDPESVASGTDLLRRATELARVRAFSLLASGVYPLADIVEAYADLARLHARGKVVVATHMVSTFRTLKARDVHEAS